MRTVGALVFLLGAVGLVQGEEMSPGPWPGGARAAVALTYDDGLDLHLDHAAPDLDAVGLKGTFYVTGASESLARRLPEWRALALRGHELGNHALFHPCLKEPPGGGGDRDWVRPEYALESYSVAQMANEARVMNTLLAALDGEAARTFAYNCTETTAGGESYVDALRPLFTAARVGGDRIVEDVGGLDPLLVPSWAVEEASGAEMIAFVERAVAAEGMAVFMFHGVGRGVPEGVPGGPSRAGGVVGGASGPGLDGHAPPDHGARERRRGGVVPVTEGWNALRGREVSR